MNSFRVHITILAAFVAASAGWFSTAFAQTASVSISIDRRLPPDVYAYITIPSVPELKKRFKASSFGELLRDKAFAEFLKDVEVAIKKGSAIIEKEIGLKLDDLLEIPAGEIAVAVCT